MSIFLVSCRRALALGLSLGLARAGPAVFAAELVNVSYDLTRELYQAFNAAFARHWRLPRCSPRSAYGNLCVAPYKFRIDGVCTGAFDNLDDAIASARSRRSHAPRPMSPS